MLGNVYFIQQTKDNLFKIGVSKDVQSRLKQLQTGQPYPLEIYMVVESFNPYGLEKIFHRIFSHHKLEGEWFSITPEQINNAIKEYKNIGKYERSLVTNGICRICQLHFIEESPEDRAYHKSIHKQLAAGKVPYKVAKFIEAHALAIAFNDGFKQYMENNKSIFIDEHDPEVAKLVLAYMNWLVFKNEYGTDVRGFDNVMKDQLEYLDAMDAHDTQEASRIEGMIEFRLASGYL